MDRDQMVGDIKAALASRDGYVHTGASQARGQRFICGVVKPTGQLVALAVTLPGEAIEEEVSDSWRAAGAFVRHVSSVDEAVCAVREAYALQAAVTDMFACAKFLDLAGISHVALGVHLPTVDEAKAIGDVTGVVHATVDEIVRRARVVLAAEGRALGYA